MYRVKLGIGLILYLLVNMLSAQSDTMIYDIGDIVVRENRIQLALSKKPSNVLIINSEMIKNMPVENIPDLLHYHAGVDIRQRGANGIQNDPGIRGSSFDQVLILINGVRMSDPQTGHHSFNLPVDIDAIDHIEVYKGSSARVFGQNAFAGAINIITKIPETNMIRLKARAGDFGLWGGGMSASFGSKSFRNYLSIEHELSGGYKYNTDYNISNVFYQAEKITGSGIFGFTGGYSKRSFGANGFYASPDYKDQYESVQTSLVAFSFSPEFRNFRIKMNNRIYWRGNLDEYLFIRSDPSYYRNMHINNTIGLDVNMSINSSAGITGIGIDASVPRIRSNRLGNQTRTAVSVFIEHHFFLFNDRLSINPGFQYNAYSDFENNLLPGIDIGYMLSSKLMLFVNTGYTYRIPTFTDLYYQDPLNAGNPYLEPEYAFSNEIGIKSIGSGGIYFQCSAFSREGRNIIDRVKDDIDDKWQPENIASVMTKGLDFSVSVHPGEMIHSDIKMIKRLSLAYTYLQSEKIGVVSQHSRFSLENLRNQLVASLDMAYSSKLFQTVNFRYSDRVNLDDYFVADTRIGWRNDNCSVHFDITNIFNKEYMETNLVILPGRWFKAGISFTIK